MDEVFTKAIEGGELVWLENLGWGYVRPVKPLEYNGIYFEHYAQLAETDIGHKLHTARVELVNRYTQDEVVDIGIGSGAFIKTRGGKTFGFDINPSGIDWLKANRLFVDPYSRDCESMTFWDSLEHIPVPGMLLAKIKRFAFVSMPIYRDVSHVLSSKHFKPNEHVYYFTHKGCILWMSYHGFDCRLESYMEVACGREDIGTFVFERRIFQPLEKPAAM